MPGIIGAGRSPPHRSSMARHTSRRDTSAFSPRFHVVFAVGAESRIGTPLGHAFESFVGESLQSFDQIQVSGTSRPGSSQLVAAQGPTCRSVGGKHTAKTGQDFCCRDMEATSLCFPFASLARERGKSFSY